MTETVAVVVATYGNRHIWEVLKQRAIESAEAQTRPPDEIISVHGANIAAARNEGVQKASSDWVICLDADDELDTRYVESMLAGTGDVRQPATLGIVDGAEDDAPVVIPRKPLYDGNYIVIGAMVRRDLFLRVGGFDDLPCFEDWQLWIKCEKARASFGVVPEAIYRVHVNPKGRNHSVSPAARDKLLWDIRCKYYPERWTTPW